MSPPLSKSDPMAWAQNYVPPVPSPSAQVAEKVKVREIGEEIIAARRVAEETRELRIAELRKVEDERKEREAAGLAAAAAAKEEQERERISAMQMEEAARIEEVRSAAKAKEEAARGVIRRAEEEAAAIRAKNEAKRIEEGGGEVVPVARVKMPVVEEVAVVKTKDWMKDISDEEKDRAKRFGIKF